jgi:hypothetical protein
MHDSNVIRRANLYDVIPPPYYILFDAGATLSDRILTPFRSTRYHLAEFCNGTQSRPPVTPQEVFNLRHSRKRTRVEISFAFLKLRFRSLGTRVTGSLPIINLHVNACVLLHNFIQGRFGKDDTVSSLAKRLACDVKESLQAGGTSATNPHSLTNTAGATLRDRLAAECFADFSRSRDVVSIGEIQEQQQARNVAA